jgi:ribose transport system permease protein
VTAATASVKGNGSGGGMAGRLLRDNAWALGLLVFLGVLLVFTKIINPAYDQSGVQGLATSILPLALAAVAQAVVVISGGIDLSIASMMALTSCVAATLMKGQSEEFGVAVVIGVLILGLFLGAINGALIVITKVPDIIVTLGTSFVWAGFALLVTQRPAGGAAQWLKDLVVGPLGLPLVPKDLLVWTPKAALVLIVLVAVVWIPIRRSRLGLSLYAIGSNQLAAYRSGVSVSRTKIIAYVITGLFSAIAGLSLTASTGIGTPVPDGTYVLLSIAAVVLGGVSLAGGIGGVFGPIVAVLVLQLIRTDMTFLGFNPNYALVAQGLILIVVLMAGSFISIRRARR